MKHINLILSVLFWAVASVSMAITLPSTSYSSSAFFSDLENPDFTITSGASYTNFSLKVANDDEDGLECARKGEDCVNCCTTIMESKYGGEWFMSDEAEAKYGDCLTSCEGWSLGDEETPLGSPLSLLAFLAAYAVLRKRKQA